VRVRDGYSFVMAIKPRDTMRCPACRTTVDMPVCETREVKCPTCAKHGIDARWPAAFYPLNHLLITFLKKIDPLRTADVEGKNALDDVVGEVDAANAALEKGRERDTFNHVEAATFDNWKDIADIGRSTKPR
jgi:hypothetical protein